MLDRILDQLDPYISETIWLIVVAPILDRIRWVFKTRESRDALQSALQSGVDRITDVLVVVVLANPVGFKLDQYAGKVADYVFASVPDAIKFLMRKAWFWRILGRTPMTELEQRAWVEDMALAKLNRWAAEFVARLRPDELAKVLEEAGATRRSGPSVGY